MLHLLSERFAIDFIGLYRDDGYTAQILSKKQADRARKDIIDIFKSCGFAITVEINFPRMDMMYVTFELPSGNTGLIESQTTRHSTYIPSQIVHHSETHAQKSINYRLSSIWCDETEFDKAKLAYEQALKNSGFNSTLTYTAPSQ